jgi:hypothetical protein
LPHLSSRLWKSRPTLRAAEKDKLTSAQDPLVAQAKVLLQAFAKVGVTALIDEATGHQEIRDLMPFLLLQSLKPEAQWKAAVLKDGADPDGELLTAFPGETSP